VSIDERIRDEVSMHSRVVQVFSTLELLLTATTISAMSNPIDTAAPTAVTTIKHFSKVVLRDQKLVFLKSVTLNQFTNQ